MFPSLNYYVLTDVIYALKEGDLSYAETLGFTLEEINEISQLPFDSLFSICHSPVSFIAVKIHHDILRKRLERVRTETQYHQQINRAIRLGGSIALLKHYFGLTSNDVCLNRRLQGISVPYGRTPLPDETMDATIWCRWKPLKGKSPDANEALNIMMQITEELASEPNPPSLTVVCNRITFCEQGRTDRRT